METLQAAVSRLEAETEQQRRHSAALQHHLDSLRDVLANSFAHLPLPGSQPNTHSDGSMPQSQCKSFIQSFMPMTWIRRALSFQKSENFWTRRVVDPLSSGAIRVTFIG